jgi:Shikimate dehydrogenase substrate binding domain
MIGPRTRRPGASNVVILGSSRVDKSHSVGLGTATVPDVFNRSESSNEKGMRIDMPDHLSGATRLFPIIGDPIKYVESPQRLTRTFEERGYNGICVPMQVSEGGLDTVMAGLTASLNVDGILSQCRTSSLPSASAPQVPNDPRCSRS